MPGTGQKLVLDGNTFRIMSGSDHTFLGGVYANESVAHSGGSTQKKVRQADGITGIQLELSVAEHDRLKVLNDRIGNFPISYVDPEGNTHRGIGYINYQGMTQQDNQGTVDVYSSEKNGLVLFRATAPTVV